uniref:Uncharacterized protein n=1 Tax=Rhizophora mucronata TaxID=61149 RepID=A0A2P2N1Y5_RHIMU
MEAACRHSHRCGTCTSIPPP